MRLLPFVLKIVFANRPINRRGGWNAILRECVDPWLKAEVEIVLIIVLRHVQTIPHRTVGANLFLQFPMVHLLEIGWISAMGT